MDGEEKVAQAVREVFSASDIPTLGNTVQTRWVTVPEWGGKSVCVWGTTMHERLTIESDAAMEAQNPARAANRRQIAAVIDCVRDGDGPDAKPIFERSAHWAWMEKQPTSVLDPLFECIRELDSSGTAMAAVEDFFRSKRSEFEGLFGVTALKAEVDQLRSCLSYTASASGACTDCPQSSATCPRGSSTSPLQPTES